MIKHLHKGHNESLPQSDASAKDGRLKWKDFIKTSQFVEWKQHLHRHLGHQLVVVLDENEVCVDVYVKKAPADS